ncbi:MAG: hypothetical protein WBK28_00905, partial [Minisyncoccia bacterium]
MRNVSEYSIGLLHELAIKAAKANYSPKDLAEITEEDLRQLRLVRRGNASITVVPHLIDCDADPFVPDGLFVKEHQKGGQLQWDPTKVSLWRSRDQQGNKLVKGYKLRERLESKHVLNACVLGDLLQNPELIPPAWKGKTVFFWGTVYRDNDMYLFICFLYWK